MKTSEQISELAAALAAAQGMMENAVMNRVNPHFKSKYADLAAVLSAARKPLSANGLAIVRLAGEHQRYAAHRQDSSKLRSSPGFAEPPPERGVHHDHDGVDVAGRAAVDADVLLDGGHHAASGTRASGARA